MLWIIAAVLIDAAAVCAWIFLISRFDKHRRQKNQTRLLVYFYLIGMGSCIVSAVTYYPLSWIVRPLYGGRWDVNYFFYHLLVVGPGEELIKFLAFAFLAVKLGTIKELKDGILQACSTALGFGVIPKILISIIGPVSTTCTGNAILRRQTTFKFVPGRNRRARASACFTGYLCSGRVTGERRRRFFRIGFPTSMKRKNTLS